MHGDAVQTPRVEVVEGCVHAHAVLGPRKPVVPYVHWLPWLQEETAAVAELAALAGLGWPPVFRLL